MANWKAEYLARGAVIADQYIKLTNLRAQLAAADRLAEACTKHGECRICMQGLDRGPTWITDASGKRSTVGPHAHDCPVAQYQTTRRERSQP